MQINKYLTSPSESCKHFFLKRCLAETKLHSGVTWRRSLSPPQLLNMLSQNRYICGSLLSERKVLPPTACITVITSVFSHFPPEQPLLHFHFFIENSLYINHLVSPKDPWNLFRSVETILTQCLKGEYTLKKKKTKLFKVITLLQDLQYYPFLSATVRRKDSRL